MKVLIAIKKFKSDEFVLSIKIFKLLLYFVFLAQTSFYHNYIIFYFIRGRGGIVEGVVYSDLTLYGDVGDAILIDMFYADVPPTNATATPIFRDVLVRHIKGVAKVAGMSSNTQKYVARNFYIKKI